MVAVELESSLPCFPIHTQELAEKVMDCHNSLVVLTAGDLVQLVSG